METECIPNKLTPTTLNGNKSFLKHELESGDKSPYFWQDAKSYALVFVPGFFFIYNFKNAYEGQCIF